MGAVLLGQLLVATGALAAISISPSPSTGSYTVTWTASVAQFDTRLHERVGSGAWSVVGTYAPSVNSKAFSGKTAGTYSYKTEQCGTFFGSTTCWDSEGPESVTVSAAPTPALTASISWNPSTVDYGGSSTLSWSSTNATSCTLDGATRATSGSRVETNRTRTHTSTLSCTGPGGASETESATLTVNPTVPDAPAKPEVNPGDGRLEVSWTAPAANGSPLTRYGMHYKATSASSWTTHPLSSAGTGTSTTITKLANGTTYQLQVRAHNAVGASAFSATARGTPRDVPAVPARPAVVEGDERLTVTWTAPADNGAAIDDYDVQYKRTSASSWRSHAFSGTGTSTTIRNLTNGLEYEVQVQAHNAAGDSGFSGSRRGTPRDVPDVPAKPALTPGSTRLTVSWTAPADNGAAIDDYDVQYKRTSASSWRSHAFSGTGTSTTIRNLTNGLEYEVQVQAHNAAGDSGFSRSAMARLALAPALSVLPSPSTDGAYTVSWGITRCFSVPFGGGQVCRVLQERVGESGSWTVVSGVATTATSHGVTGKTQGTYYYRLVIGTGTTAVVVAGPESVEVERVPTASISWNPSTVDYGGTSTLSWSSTSVTGCTLDGTDRGTSGSREQTNLTQPQTSELSCTAADDSEVSDSATLKVLPAVPAAPVVKTGTGVLTVSWTAPADGGAAITAYRVSYKRRVYGPWQDQVVSGTVTRTTISRLTNGWPYLVQVRARNAAGWSDGSGETPATPLAAPATPTGPSTSTGTHTVSWGTVTGATTGYKIRERLGAGSWEEYDEATPTSKLFSNRKRGDWEYQVQACNSGGCGDWSGGLTIEVRPLLEITIEPSPSLDGDYTVSWGAPRCFGVGGFIPQICYVLQERVDGSEEWTDVPGVATLATSYPFSAKTNGTYYYQLVIGVGGTVVVAGPESVEVERVPTASISWNPSTVDYGGTSTLSWSSTSVTGCTLDGTDRGTSGSREQTNLTQPQTSELSCTAADDSEVSDSATLKVLPAVPAAPVVKTGTGVLTVSWTAPADGGAAITAYRVSYKRRVYGPWQDQVVSGTVTRTTISRLTNGWPYLVQVRARNAAGWSDGSGETPATPLAAPATPTGPSTSTGTHTVSWGTVTGATTGYKIRERLGAGSWEEYDEATPTSKLFSNRKRGDWEYQVQACNSGGCGDWSGGLTIEVRPLLEITIEPSPSLDGDYTVSWGAPRCFGVGGFIPQICYVLQERVDGSEEWTDVPGVATLATSYPFSAKTNGTYYYQLVIGVGGTVVVAGPESVEVERVPTASISWNPSTVDYGGTSTLSWSSTDVTGCTLDGTDRGTSGSGNRPT